jgi:hypothetical protein
MVACNDPLVEAYKDVGFNLLRLPRADFVPLLLLNSDGRRELVSWGRLSAELPGSKPVPRVSRNARMADVSVNRTRGLSASVTARLVGPLLGAVGIPDAPEVAADLTRDGSIAIVLRDVTRDSIDVGDLAAYVEAGLSPRTDHVRSLGERGELYVVTAVARSDTLRIEIGTSAAARVKAKASATPGVITPVVEPAGSVNSSAAAVYTSRHVLTFGFRAVQLSCRDGRWGIYSDVHGKIAHALPPHQRRPRLLILDADLADVEPADAGTRPADD